MEIEDTVAEFCEVICRHEDRDQGDDCESPPNFRQGTAMNVKKAASPALVSRLDNHEGSDHTTRRTGAARGLFNRGFIGE